MSRATRPQPGRTPAGNDGCTVTVCRGCCCGRPEKNPGVDHTGQLDQLRRTLHGGTTNIRLTDCLGVCERSNVLVIQPSRIGRAAGGRPVWLGLVHDTEVIDDITTWITDGGPGLTDPPPILDLYQFTPSRRIRNDAHLE
jgi:(2Fe-2S) ferredoxin